MRKIKKINGFLVVKFNDKERRENPSLGLYGVIDAELYTGDIDFDRSEMEYDDAETLEIAVEQARGLDAEKDFSDEPPTYTVVIEEDDSLTEEEVFPQLLIDGWERKLSSQIGSSRYPDTDPRTAAHELYGFKVALHRLGLIRESDTTVDPDHFAQGVSFGPLPKQPEELLAYVCDKVCKHREECIGQDELDASCAECSVERLARDAEDRDLRIVTKAKERLNDLIAELESTQLNTKAERLEIEARAYLDAVRTAQILTAAEAAAFDGLIGSAVESRPYAPERDTFENLEAPLKNFSLTKKIYSFGEILEGDCPDNDCRVFLNIYRMAREVDALLDEVKGHPAQVLRRDLRQQLDELRRMYLENYAVQQYKEGLKA